MLELSPLTPTDCRFLSGGAHPKAVQLESSVAESLRADAVEALRSLPRYGLEIGGILLGKNAGEQLIEKFVPVESEHLFGPRYHLSEQDHATLHTKLEELRRPASSHEAIPVGLYRTCTRGQVAPEEIDVKVLDRHFAAADAIFLSVAPKMNGRAELLCSVWNQGTLIPCTANPLQVSIEASASPTPDVPREAVREPVLFARFGSFGSANHVPRTAGTIQWIREAVLGAAAAVIVFLGLVAMHRSPRSAVVVPNIPVVENRLGARLESTSHGSEARWNPNAEPLRAAMGGLLTVEQQGQRVDVPISLAELQTGSLFIGEAQTQAKFFLTVYLNNEDEIQEQLHLSTPQSAPVKTADAR